MRVVRRTYAPAFFVLVSTSLSGCGTIPEDSSSTSAIARAEEAPRTLPAALRPKPPTWLTAGSIPAPTSPPAPSIAIPDVRPTEEKPISVVPQVHEKRWPTNNGVAEPAPPVRPIPVMGNGEPEWRPGGAGPLPRGQRAV